MSMSACWGSNSVETDCAWIYFGYGSCYDLHKFWVNLETAKALARRDYKQNGHMYEVSDEDWNNASLRIKHITSAWYIEHPKGEEESHRWFGELLPEFSKNLVLKDGSTWSYDLIPSPDDTIADLCREKEKVTWEAKYGYESACYDGRWLHICTTENEWYNGGGDFNHSFPEHDEVILPYTEMYFNADIVAHAVHKNHLKVYGVEISFVDNDPYIFDETYDLINIYDEENSTGTYIQKIELDEGIFKITLVTPVGMRYLYTFDPKVDCKQDEAIIKKMKDWKIEQENAKKKKEDDWNATKPYDPYSDLCVAGIIEDIDSQRETNSIPLDYYIFGGKLPENIDIKYPLMYNPHLS